MTTTTNLGITLLEASQAQKEITINQGFVSLDAAIGATHTQTAHGRLTLTSNVAVTTNDITAATVIYFTPFRGNQIALHDGTSQWNMLSFAQLSLTVPSTTNTIYDVFGYNNAGSLSLEALAWTNDTTRATGLILQDGVYVKTGAVTRRYLGSFRTTSVSGQTEDSEVNRYVWNYQNRCLRAMRRIETVAYWNYSTNALRQANGNAANQLNFLLGLSEDAVSATLSAVVANSTATIRYVYSAIGLDSTGVALLPTVHITTAPATGGYTALAPSTTLMVSPGRHYLAWLESGAGTDTQTWIGNGECGLTGAVWA